MNTYVVTQTRELVIEAPSASVARSIAIRGFQHRLSPGEIVHGMSISNIQNEKINVEKVR